MVDASLDEDAGWTGSNPRPWRALGLGVLAFLAFDVLVFHSGIYARIAEPESFFGRYQTAVEGASDFGQDEGRPRVVVLGDSRIAEGLSAPLTAEVAGAQVLNASIPGSTPRVWAHLIEDLDPDKNRFDLVVIPVWDYEPVQDFGGHGTREDRSKRISDLTYIAPGTGIGELPELASSFPTWPGKYAAARSVLLKGYAFRRDVRALLLDLDDRLEEVETARELGMSDFDSYEGDPGDMTAVEVDWETGKVGDLSHVPAAYHRRLRVHAARQPAAPNPIEEAYRERWLGEILDRYEGTETRVMLFCVPLGPAAREFVEGGEESSFLRRMGEREYVHLLPEDKFDHLERPELFFDPVHLNREGRRQMSTMLGESMAELFEE